LSIFRVQIFCVIRLGIIKKKYYIFSLKFFWFSFQFSIFGDVSFDQRALPHYKLMSTLIKLLISKFWWFFFRPNNTFFDLPSFGEVSSRRQPPTVVTKWTWIAIAVVATVTTTCQSFSVKMKKKFFSQMKKKRVQMTSPRRPTLGNLASHRATLNWPLIRDNE
jgi:hypothetical protein